MTWTNSFFLILTLTITTTCFLCLWELGKEKWERDGWISLACHLLYGIIFFSVIPAVYVIIMWRAENSDGSTVGVAFEMTRRMEMVTVVCGFSWIAGMVLFSLKYIVDEIFLFSLQFRCMPGRKHEKEILKQCCENLGIRRKFRLYQDFRICVPMINGILRPQIYLPDAKIFNDQDLMCIFYHELTHYRHADVFFKKLTVIARCIHWFNPIIRKKLDRAISVYSEAYCDSTVCGKSYVETKSYCIVLLKALQLSSEKAPYMAVGLCESENEIEERIRRIGRIRKQRRRNRGVAVFLAVFVLVTGSITSFATGWGIVRVHEQLYNATVIEVEENLDVDEQLEYTTWGDFRGKVTEGTVKKEKIEIDPKSNFTRMEWTLAPNEIVVSPAFYMEAEDEIWLAISVDLKDKKIRGGIVGDNGEKRYVEDTELLWHGFSLREDGKYRIFIENISSVPILVYGFYD